MAEPTVGGFEILSCEFNQSLLQLNSPCSKNFNKVVKSACGEVGISCKIALRSCMKFVDVLVIKDCKKPAIVTIKFEMSHIYPEIRNSNHWTTEYQILSPLSNQSQQCLKSGSCSTGSHRNQEHNFLINARCDIIWYGFVDDFYSPNSTKVFTRYSDSMEFCDMKIKVGNKYYPAHKLVVGSQSSVLKKALTTNMKESKENCIDLTDLGSDVVEELLPFLYENKIDKAEEDEDLLLKLLKAGEMYNIPDLKNCCGMFLSNSLMNDETNNVLMLLENAHIYQSSILQTRVIALIVEEEQKILEDKKFKELGKRHPELLLEILSIMKFLIGS